MCTPEQALSFTGPTDGFLCGIDANVYDIDFARFTLRDIDSNQVLFDIEKPPGQRPTSDDDPLRTNVYSFPKEFLQLRTIGAQILFTVGQHPVPKFRMIERHYFGNNRLVKSFDFTFGFCIPNSSNSWEAIYDLPQLTDDEIAEFVANPGAVESDSFYFAGDQLIMHIKSSYTYL
eukprot:PhM_4_TR6761/c0_g1_i1/m.39037